MGSNRLNFYYFGDVGEYDCYNPTYVWSMEYASQILYLIASNDPFSICKQEISTLLNIKHEKIDDVINNLQLIGAIEVKDNTYRVKFPVFLEQDVIKMQKFINNIGELMGEKIISLGHLLYEKISYLQGYKLHSNERLLYHIICDEIFDGTAFEFFRERDAFCTSKLQSGGRNYIIVGYEYGETLQKHSNKLLCSSNNYTSSIFTFNSFGDADGARKDVFNFFKLIQKSVQDASPFIQLNESYNKILSSMSKDLIFKCGELICKIIGENYKYNQITEDEKLLINFLKELEYIDFNEINNSISINIPVFYESEKSTIIKELSDIVLFNIFPIIKESFEDFKANASDYACVKHNVDIKEITNELWHQIFGEANEYLVKEGFVSTPHGVEGKGRYLSSLIVNDL